MSNVKLITIVKNRYQHFLQTFPFMTSQYGTEYDFVIVDYHSTDWLPGLILKQIAERKESFSPYLNKIFKITLQEDLKFNSKKARNLGASWFSNESSIFSFCDVDTLLGMTYLSYWSSQIEKNKSFAVTRYQDTQASLPARISPEINYGNMTIFSDDYFLVSGYDEAMSYYGGGDDDIFHRIKLAGLREINPYSAFDSRQFSIIHNDESRISLLEEPRRADKNLTFSSIYKNKDSHILHNKFINLEHTKQMSKIEVLYER